MKRRLFAPLLVAALLLAFGTVAAACGGGGGLTLEEYFQRIEAAGNDRDAKSEALEEKFDEKFGEEFASEEEQLDAFRDFFNASIPVLRDFADALKDADPPAEVEDAHEEAVNAGAEVVKLAEDFADRLAGMESTSEVDELFDDPELEAAGNRFEQTCVTLQGIADDNGIVVDLNCGDEVE